MTKRTAIRTARGLPSTVLATLLALTILVSAGCDSPGGTDGDNITDLSLTEAPDNDNPTLLNLFCENVGVFIETCVLDDPENPFRSAIVREFDENDPDAETKFELAADITPGPLGAKARFYLWATALARRGSGENQYFTALALHELFTVNNDPVIREQALKAYRSVWDNYFGSVVFFTCCGEFFPTPRDDTAFAVPLNELVLERLVRASETQAEGYPGGFAPLIPDDPTGLDAGLIELEAQEVISEWGFNYQCTGTGAARLCFVSVNGG